MPDFEFQPGRWEDDLAISLREAMDGEATQEQRSAWFAAIERAKGILAFARQEVQGDV